ncbi:hypothetical protein [Mesorhizobium sp. M0030]|uniref:hypothetical protein n=1 Tax=Mesorhizobium sp. M0030 TaxID=2956851 RepID=UPI003338F50D
MLFQHFMPQRLLATFAILCLTQGAAAACQKLPKAESEDMEAPEVLVVRAKVTSLKVRVGHEEICYDVSYDVQEIYHGSIKGPLSISNCASIDAEEALALSQRPGKERQAEADFEGTEVVAGFTSRPPPKVSKLKPQKSGKLRLLVPSCWGPMIYPIDKMSESERAEIIKAAKDPQQYRNFD